MKRTSHNAIRITVQPSFCAIAVLAVIILPFRWVGGWLLAVAIHELGHLLGISIFRIRIYSVSIMCSGTYIRTSPMLPIQEIVVAAMGPVIGLLPVFFSRWIPYTAICAIVQFTFNLLPIVGFDGYRVLRGFVQLLLSYKNTLQ